jgi:ribosomal silencing factor RsfS
MIKIEGHQKYHKQCAKEEHKKQKREYQKRNYKPKQKNYSWICCDCGTIISHKVKKDSRCKKCIAKHFDKIYHSKEGYKKRRKETFCKITGMSRDRYLELKEFMGIE